MSSSAQVNSPKFLFPFAFFRLYNIEEDSTPGYRKAKSAYIIRIDMRCPNCQTINPPAAKFCLECGKRLVICPNCGTVNVPLAKFCIECGTALAPKGDITRPLAPTALADNDTRLTLPEERRVVTI